MPSIIRVGSKVMSNVGPFRIVTVGDKNGVTGKKKKTRNQRSPIHGWVVASGRPTSEKNSWRVLWSNCGKTCDHSASRLTVINDEVDGFEHDVFERLLPVDYFTTRKQLYSLMDRGNYQCLLRLEPLASSTTATGATGTTTTTTTTTTTNAGRNTGKCKLLFYNSVITNE